jgi:hypothetical protein
MHVVEKYDHAMLPGTYSPMNSFNLHIALQMFPGMIFAANVAMFLALKCPVRLTHCSQRGYPLFGLDKPPVFLTFSYFLFRVTPNSADQQNFDGSI